MSYTIAVGYDIGSEAIEEFKKNVVDLFGKKLNSGKTLSERYPDFNLSDFTFQSQILSGVFYHTPPAGDDECRKNQEEMVKWYDKHKSDEYIFIDSFYYHYSKNKNGIKNPLLIIASCHNISGHRFYSFLSNMTSGPSTTCHKRNINNKLYSGPFTFDSSLKVKAKSYIYNS